MKILDSIFKKGIEKRQNTTMNKSESNHYRYKKITFIGGYVSGKKSPKTQNTTKTHPKSKQAHKNLRAPKTHPKKFNDKEKKLLQTGANHLRQALAKIKQILAD